MKTAIFSSQGYERILLNELNRDHELVFFDFHLNAQSANLAAGFPAVSAFVNDRLDRQTLQSLYAGGTRVVVLRSAGYNHVDMEAARAIGLKILRVPAYSPHAIAEHTLALILCLNRKIHKAYNRVRESNFSLDGLLGFDLAGKTVGVVGTGMIGALVCRILAGFGCRVIACDVNENEECRKLGVTYLGVEELFRRSNIVTLHCPLTKITHHLVNESTLRLAKEGLMLINTGRGGLIDTRAAIAALKTGKIGSLGLDVYEEEEKLFFEDRSESIIQDDTFARLLSFSNVLITGHQAFYTKEAVGRIVETTLENLSAFEQRRLLTNEVLG